MDKNLKILNTDNSVIIRRALIACYVIIAFIAGRLTAATPLYIADINEFADAVSDYYKIDHSLLRAIIFVESSYDTNAQSHKGAFNVMQVTEPAYTDYLRFNPNTPYTNFEMVKTNWQANIAVGAWYLVRFCYKYSGTWKKAISAYFWGLSHKTPTLVYYTKVKSRASL